MYAMPARLENCPTMTLPCPAKWKLQGHSKAGERTGFWLEPLNIVLDAGLSTYKSPKAIFLSHSHTDHSFEITSIYEGREKAILKGKRKLINERGRPIIMQEYCVPLIGKVLDCRTDLSTGIFDYCKTNGIDPWYRRACYPFVVDVGMRYVIDELPNIEIEILKGFHSANSVGYGFNTISNKLVPELLELVKNDKLKFMELKNKYEKDGIVITERQVIPQMVYYGDTNILALTMQDEWKKYPVIIIECTLFGDKSKISEHQYTEHIYWEDLKSIIKENTQNYFVLIHTSMSVDVAFLNELELNEKEKNSVVNFTFWK